MQREGGLETVKFHDPRPDGRGLQTAMMMLGVPIAQRRVKTPDPGSGFRAQQPASLQAFYLGVYFSGDTNLG
jgi:hypothetical protein